MILLVDTDPPNPIVSFCKFHRKHLVETEWQIPNIGIKPHLPDTMKRGRFRVEVPGWRMHADEVPPINMIVLPAIASLNKQLMILNV